jgi:cell division septation protein DedD
MDSDTGSTMMRVRRHKPSNLLALMAVAGLCAVVGGMGGSSAEEPLREAGVQTETAAIGTDRFFVQLASLRTEQRAREELAQLRSDYQRDLRAYNFTVQRADLGAKGVFYRVLVGPYLSRFVASGYCSEIRSVGGDCMVLRRKDDTGP